MSEGQTQEQHECASAQWSPFHGVTLASPGHPLLGMLQQGDRLSPFEGLLADLAWVCLHSMCAVRRRQYEDLYSYTDETNPRFRPLSGR